MRSPFKHPEVEKLVLFALKQDCHRDDRSKAKTSAEFLSWLTTAPKYTTYRINTMKAKGYEVTEEIKAYLHKLADGYGGRVPDVYVHPLLHDVVIVENWIVGDLQPQSQEVIVDAACGAAVLRGAHVFAPGIMGIQTGINHGDIVSVFADVAGKCKRGLQHIYDVDCKVFLGNGVVQMNRKEVFCTDKPIGVAVRMIATVSGCPALSSCLTLPGRVLLQNLPSVLCCHVLNPQPQEIILDMCAAPGNKTSHIATIMGDTGIVIALDKTKPKVESIQKRCKEFSLNNIHAFVCDATKSVKEGEKYSLLEGPPFPSESFDRILLDAPCSALGQRPQLRNSITVAQLHSYPSLQQKLMKAAVSLLKPGGVLVYSTCTITLEENEEMVSWALKHFSCLNLKPAIPSLGQPGYSSSSLTAEQCSYVQRFGPANDDGCNYDTVGFFVAQFCKIGP